LIRQAGAVKTQLILIIQLVGQTGMINKAFDEKIEELTIPT